MNTSTAIAVALAIIIAFGFLFFGQSIMARLSGGGAIITTSQTTTKTANTNTSKTIGTSTTPVVTDANNLSVTDDVIGTGAVAKAGDIVSVQYVGTLSNGTVFDSTKAHGNKPFTFTLGAGQVIKGWDMGVAGMKVGGTRKLVIPPALGYGDRTVGPIPANSTLTFEIKLIKVTPPATK